MRVDSLLTEGLATPLGLEERTPRLSWRVALDAGESSPSAAEIRAAATSEDLDGGSLLWHSGRVETSMPWLDWGGPDIADRQRVFWQVRLWPSTGEPTPWSDTTWFEAGIADGAWTSQWVDAPGVHSPLFRHSFTLDRPDETPVRARLYCSAGGFFEARLNGERLGDTVLFPLHTDYTQRIGYAAFDVGDLVQAGTNVIGMITGGGWYERFGYGRRCIRCQIEIDWADGHRQIAGDRAIEWLAAPGPWRREGIYDGEWYDARLVHAGWGSDAYDAGDWLVCARCFARRLPAEPPGGRMEGVIAPPIRIHTTLEPASVERAAPGRILIDTGKNLAGWLQVRVKGKLGETLQIRYGEERTEDGDVDQKSNHGAAGLDCYTCAGTGEEAWEPRFALHGFRYASIAAAPDVLDTVTASVRCVGSDVADAARFTCSDKTLTGLFEISRQAIRSNLQGLLTDCPQRDERQGWLGDAYGIAPTVLALFEATPFFRKWIRDMLDTQDNETGQRWSATAPVCPRFAAPSGHDRSRHRLGEAQGAPFRSDPVYSAACTFIPWQVFAASGDSRILERAYPAIVRYCHWAAEHEAWPLALQGRHGDHAEMFGDHKGPTDKQLVSSAILIDELRTARRMAEVLGRGDGPWLNDRIAEACTAFRKKYYDTEAGTYGTQTANAIALAVGIPGEGERERVVDALVKDIAAHEGHLTPGIIGMRYLLEALGEMGRRDLAYQGITADGEPGWAWMLEAGLTAMHEHRVATYPDTSQNQPAHGLVAEWMIRWVVGLRFTEPGCRAALIDPGVELPVDSAGIELDTVSGTWALGWERTGDGASVTVRVPPGCSASGPGDTLGPGGHEIAITRP